MKWYRNRVADRILQDKLEAKGAVLIEGSKWCGKTTTASQIAKSILYMQDPAKKTHNLKMAELDPALLLGGDTPRLIDEWQLAPQLWDAVRSYRLINPGCRHDKVTFWYRKNIKNDHEADDSL